jgi:hypothetical protein
MSKLTKPQEDYVRTQAAKGATLSDIQNGLREEHDVHLTYMDARLLMIDLSIVLDEDKEPEPEPEPPAPTPQPTAEDSFPDEAGEPDYSGLPTEEDFAALDGPEEASTLELSVDALTRPGYAISGKITFSDGKNGSWYIDQSGRMGIVPPEPGYQPPAQDIPVFQQKLALEMRKMGYY